DDRHVGTDLKGAAVDAGHDAAAHAVLLDLPDLEDLAVLDPDRTAVDRLRRHRKDLVGADDELGRRGRRALGAYHAPEGGPDRRRQGRGRERGSEPARAAHRAPPFKAGTGALGNPPKGTETSTKRS